MKTSANDRQWWRALLIAPIAVFAIASILATGHDDDDDPPPINGGGNGGDNGGTVLPPTILNSYNFEIGSTLAGPLTADAGALATVSLDFGTTLLGTINLDVSGTGDVTLLSTVTDAGSSFTLSATSTLEPALNASATVSVTEAINASVFDDPTSGAFEITTTPPIGTITVGISGTGVDISLAGGTPTSYTWEEFTDLVTAPSALDHERVASLIGGAYEFIFELALLAAEELDELEAVTLSNPTIDDCDMFTGTQPPNVLAQGTATITWTGSGELMPGQSFLAEFADCWFDDPTDDTDELWNGMIQLSNYVEEIDANNTLTRIGFAPDATVNGGVEFLGFTIDETDEDPATGNFTIDPTNRIVVNGGFSLLFIAP